MLREDHTIAANDAARLDDIETSTAINTAANLGAELRDASPEVRAAAVLRSQRLPDPSIMRDAWRSLPGSLQDRIGTAAITHSFYSRESQENPCGLTLEAGRWAGEIETHALNEVETIAIAALPELYGTDDAAPPWTLSDTPLSFPDPLATILAGPTRLPRKVRAEAAARSKRIPGLDDIMAAWSRLPPSDQDQLGVQAVAVAFYGWLSDDAWQAPADRWLTDRAIGQSVARSDRAMKLVADIARRSLPELFGTRRRDPAWARGAVDAEAALGTLWEAALPSPILFAIALHRRTWQALQASNAFLDATGRADRKPLVWPAQDAEAEALFDIGKLPCGSRKDAAALLSHLRWYFTVARRQLPDASALHPRAEVPIKARMADLALMLGEPSVAGGDGADGGADLPALIEVHRAAWSAYVAVDPREDREAHFALSDTASEAAEAVLAAPCACLADGERLMAHSAWLTAALAAAGETLAEDFTCTAGEIAARAGDWSVHFGDGGRAA